MIITLLIRVFSIKYRIDLLETCYQDKEFISIDNDYSDDDWIKCYIKENQFIGVGDPTKLEKIILIFKTWIESQ